MINPNLPTTSTYWILGKKSTQKCEQKTHKFETVLNFRIAMFDIIQNQLIKTSVCIVLSQKND